MIQYQTLLRNVLALGEDRQDRTGTGTRSLFGAQLRFDLEDGFPLVTLKKTNFKAVVQELLWFISGSTNVKDLGNGIWDAWADENGDLGPIYGRQWARQLPAFLQRLKDDPESRRHVVCSWQVDDLPQMALAPCHVLFQCHISRGKLSLQVYQRSADLLLGVPFNVASYALLTHMLAQQCGLGVGDLVWTAGDCHIYANHQAAAWELVLNRRVKPLPDLRLVPAPTLFDYTLENVRLDNYYPHPPIALPVAV